MDRLFIEEYTCENCVFWRRHDHPKVVGDCRFNPPQKLEASGLEYGSVFPVTPATESCGRGKLPTD